MKAYLVISGSLFGLVAFLHLLRAIDERSMFNSQPGYFLGMAALGVLAGVLAFWAWRLLRQSPRA